MVKNEFDYMYEEFERKIKDVDETHYLVFESVCGWSLEMIIGTIHKIGDKYKIIVNRSSKEVMNELLPKTELMDVNHLDTLRRVNIKEIEK